VPSEYPTLESIAPSPLAQPVPAAGAGPRPNLCQSMPEAATAPPSLAGQHKQKGVSGGPLTPCVFGLVELRGRAT